MLAQSSDPGAIGAGSYWADTDAEATFRRNDANTAWLNLLQSEKGTTFPTAPTLSDLFIHTGVDLLFQFGGWKTNPYIWGALNQSAIYDDGIGYSTQAIYDLYWISNDTAKARGNPTNDNVDITFDVSSADKNIYLDLGQALSDTIWAVRFKMNFTTLTVAANAFFHIVLSSVAATGSTTTADTLGMRISNETVNKYYSTIDTDAATLNATGINTASAAITWATGTDYYVEIKRTSSTAYTVTIYTDSAFTTTLVAATTGTVAATTTGLRYFSICNPNAATAGVFTGTIDEVFIIDGRTAYS